MRRVAAYPWATLERLSRDAVRGAREARRRVARAVRVEELGRTLSAVLATERMVVVRDVSVAPAAPHPDAALSLADGTLVLITVDPELASAALARVLGRTPSLDAPGRGLDAGLRGALAALIAEVARRTRAAEPLHVVMDLPPHVEPCVTVEATVVLDGKPYRARAWVRPSQNPVREDAAADSVAALGELPVSLGVVVALSLASAGELRTLAPGDAWLPGDGWWIDARGVGRGALAAAPGERGVAVDLAPDGSIVLGGEVLPLVSDAEMAKEDAEDAVQQAVLDAPIVVRVELGSVSLSAREWAALRPGDVIETGKRINEPVVLRVAGQEVARGELVEIEGELGVRVRQLVGRGPEV